mgnify:CR=1 FL=1
MIARRSTGGSGYHRHRGSKSTPSYDGAQALRRRGILRRVGGQGLRFDRATGFSGIRRTILFAHWSADLGQPYRKPHVVPPGFGIAGMLIAEGYDTRDPEGYKTPPPMIALSFKSPLIDLCSSGRHYGVKVDDISLLRLITWVDAMCPYQGEEEIREIPDPEFQGIDWLAIRPRIKTAPKVVRPGPVDETHLPDR